MKTVVFRSVLASSALFFATAIHANGRAARYVVKLKDTATYPRRASVHALEAEFNGTRSFEKLGFATVEGTKEDIEASLSMNPMVEYYEPEITWRIADADAADGPGMPSKQATNPWLKDILGLNEDAPSATVGVAGSNRVLVAVVDTDTRSAHPFLSSAMVGAGGATGDHGTHVSGLVKAVRDQAIPTYSQAARVGIVSMPFIGSDGSGSTSGAIAALEQAAQSGAKVVNASWGAKGDEAYSRALYDAMVSLYERDVFISVAAGNAEGFVANDNDQTPFYPANYPIPGLMSVASITPSYSKSGSVWVRTAIGLSNFSNFGRDSVHIAAPGSMSAGGQLGVWSANYAYTDSNSLYIRKQGTSMAAPVLAGVAAVVRAINPGLTAYETKQLLLRTATPVGVLSGKVSSGGYVNAAAAFDEASQYVSRGEHPLAPEGTGPSGYGNDGASASAGFAGCATVGGPGSEGPSGGNSMALLAVGYFVWVALRGLMRRSAKTLS